MAIITKAYDTVLAKYVMPDEMKNRYQKGQKRYQCPICFDWLSLANTPKRLYLKHWRNSDGHNNCDLYYSQYYNSNSVQSEISKKLRQSKGIGYALYLEKRNGGWHLSLSLPAFSKDDISQYERSSSYIKIKAIDFGTETMLNINRENFAVDERRYIELSEISENYEITIGANGNNDVQQLSGAKLDGDIFLLVGSENIENNDQILTKKLQGGSKIFLKRHYLLLTKEIPKDEYLYELSMKEIARIPIKVGGLDKTRRIYDFVVSGNTSTAGSFCKKYGMSLSNVRAETQIMWPPTFSFCDDYFATNCKDIILYSDADIEVNGRHEKIGLNLYKISAEKKNIRIANGDELYNIKFEIDRVRDIRKIEYLHQQVEENRVCLLSNNIIFYNNVLYDRQKENIKMTKRMSLLRYRSNYLVSEITVQVKEKDIGQTEDLLNAIKYCKVMITPPYWLRKINLMRYDKDVIEYINESLFRKSICREVVRVLLNNF